MCEKSCALNSALFAIETVSDADLNFLQTAIQEEIEYRKKEKCTNSHLKHNENSTTNIHRDYSSVQTAPILQPIDTFVSHAAGVPMGF